MASTAAAGASNHEAATVESPVRGILTVVVLPGVCGGVVLSGVLSPGFVVFFHCATKVWSAVTV